MKEINLTEVASEVAEELLKKIEERSGSIEEQNRTTFLSLLETGFVKGFVEGEKYISDQLKIKLGIKMEEKEVDKD